MKLKRFLSLCAVCIFCHSIACRMFHQIIHKTLRHQQIQQSSGNSQTDTSSDSQDTSSDKTEKDTPSVSIPWNEVSDDYEDAAVEAKNEITGADSISVSTLKSLADTIRKDYKVIKDGVTKSNKESAKEMFVTARRLRHLPNAPAMFRRKNLSALVPAQRIMSKRFTVVDPLPFPMPITI